MKKNQSQPNQTSKSATSRLPEYNRKPVLRFSPTAWAKLIYFRDCGETEISGFGITEPDDLLYVKEFQTVKQQASIASISLDDQAIADYFEDQVDLGRQKVNATADYCQQINHGLEVYEVNDRFRRNMEIGNVIFVCVDNIEMRRLIWNAVKDKVNFFSDGRMSAEVLRILSVCDLNSYEYYPTTLFTARQAYAGACTAKTTIYSANIAAGLMLAQFTKYLRQMPVDADVQLNLLAAEISVNER